MKTRPLRSSTVLACVGVTASLALAACGSSGASTAGGGDGGGGGGGDITLGMVAPLSGSSAAFGPYMKNGAQMAIDEINAKGGVNGQKLKLDVQDGACDAKTAVSAANKLVTDQVAVSVGGYCSGATLPTLPIFNGAKIPMIIPAANSDDLVKQHLPLVFLINGTGTQQAQAAVKFIEKEGVKSVALIDDSTSYSTNIAKLTEADLKDSGSAKVAVSESINAGESDYSANVAAVLKANPDFIYFTGYYQEGGLLIRQFKQAGYSGKFMVADGSVDAKLISIAGQDNAQGVFATITQTPDTLGASASDWIAKYKKQFGADPGPYSTQSYDAVRVAAEGIKDAKSTKGDEIAKALEKIDGLQLFSGPLKFTKDHTLSSGGFVIVVVKGDKFELQDAPK